MLQRSPGFREFTLPVRCDHILKFGSNDISFLYTQLSVGMAALRICQRLERSSSPRHSSTRPNRVWFEIVFPLLRCNLDLNFNKAHQYCQIMSG